MSIALPANLPNIPSAQLPQRYEAAKVALAECSKVDECQDWADKMAALASYAKQAEDDELEAFARRVRARAIRRCGELLREIEPAQGMRTDKLPEDSHRKLTRSEAARNSGLSEHQQNTALRVSNVPQADFEEQVEGPAPATVTDLAEQGTKKKPKPLVDLEGRDPKEFALATQVSGSLHRLAQDLEGIDPAAVVRGLFDNERAKLNDSVADIFNWLTRLTEAMEA